MNGFQYYLYESRHKKEKSSLEKVFEDFINKIEFYENQYEFTLKLYNTEWKKEIEELNAKKQESLKSATDIYNEAFNEVSMAKEPEELRHSYANYISGLDNVEYEFMEIKESIKNHYMSFFDMYSKSLLVALYSLVESNLKEICDVISIDFKKKIKYEDLDSKNYLNAAKKYLDLVADIPMGSLEAHLTKLKEIQLIRNKIVHEESQFKDISLIMDVVNNSDGSLELLDNKGIMLIVFKKSDYIKSLYVFVREFYEELIWLIDEKQNNTILIKRLVYWFAMIDSKIKIINLKTKKEKGKKIKITFTLKSQKRDIRNIECNLTVSKAKNDSLVLTDQIENSQKVEDFVNLFREINGEVFSYVFEFQKITSNGIKVELILH